VKTAAFRTSLDDPMYAAPSIKKNVRSLSNDNRRRMDLSGVGIAGCAESSPFLQQELWRSAPVRWRCYFSARAGLGWLHTQSRGTPGEKWHKNWLFAKNPLCDLHVPDDRESV